MAFYIVSFDARVSVRIDAESEEDAFEKVIVEDLGEFAGCEDIYNEEVELEENALV